MYWEQNSTKRFIAALYVRWVDWAQALFKVELKSRIQAGEIQSASVDNRRFGRAAGIAAADLLAVGTFNRKADRLFLHRSSAIPL